MAPVSPPVAGRRVSPRSSSPPWRPIVLGLVTGIAIALVPAPPDARAHAADAGPAAVWQWPVPSPRILTRGYEAPASRYGAGHRGIDIRADAGSVITSPDDGVVSFAGPVVDRGVVAIRHDGDIVSSFEPVDATVSVGQLVRAGEPIATVAASSHCVGCVHLGARLRGEYLSPLALLGGVPRAVLLPLVD